MNDGIIVLQRSAQRMGMRMAILRPDGQGKCSRCLSAVVGRKECVVLKQGSSSPVVEIMNLILVENRKCRIG